jgi:hypothetical protein
MSHFANVKLFLAYFPYLGKIKGGLYDPHALCVSVNPPPPLTFECLNQ